MDDGSKSRTDKLKIAIIGSGIGGASCAYFLNDLFQNNIEIDVYEKTDKVGGRMSSFEYNGRMYEFGGTILHPKNLYMDKFTKICGLEKNGKSECTKTFFGLFDSNGFAYKNIGHYFSFLNTLNLLRHYGFGQIFKFNKILNDFIETFSKIYTLQDNGETVTSIEQFFLSLDQNLLNSTEKSLRSLLSNDFKLNQNFINELASAACLVNYNQTIDIHGFVGLVSLAGASHGLWRVKSKNGNMEVPERLLKLSNANLFLNTKVAAVKQESDSGNIVEFIQNGTRQMKRYDYVVIAFPLTKNLDKNEFNLGFDFNYQDYDMQLTKANFIEGTVCLYPNIPVDRRVDLMSCDSTMDFRSTCVQLPCDYDDKYDSKLWLDDKKKLYKAFSRVHLDDKLLSRIFREDYVVKERFDWYAYPKYDVLKENTKRTPFPKIIIDSDERSRVLYLNSIEWAASSMEMSCISARNIALMISNKEQTARKTLKLNKKFKTKSIFEKFSSYFYLSASVLVAAVLYNFFYL